jgi:hypothetical protein
MNITVDGRVPGETPPATGLLPGSQARTNPKDRRPQLWERRRCPPHPSPAIIRQPNFR